jgi:hypothetical protein
MEVDESPAEEKMHGKQAAYDQASTESESDATFRPDDGSSVAPSDESTSESESDEGNAPILTPQARNQTLALKSILHTDSPDEEEEDGSSDASNSISSDDEIDISYSQRLHALIQHVEMALDIQHILDNTNIPDSDRTVLRHVQRIAHNMQMELVDLATTAETVEQIEQVMHVH